MAALSGVLRELSAQSGGNPVAVLYDPARGFVCATAQLQAHDPAAAPSTALYSLVAPADWWRPSLAGSVSVLSAVRFVAGSLVGIVWRRR